MIFGLLMGYLCLETELIYSFVSAIICYVLLSILDIKSGMAHKAVFVFSMLFLSAWYIFIELKIAHPSTATCTECIEITWDGLWILLALKCFSLSS